MKCALLATFTLEHTMAAFYCPARVCGWDLIDISIRNKQWVLYHNMHQVTDQTFDVEHGDYFALFENIPSYDSRHPVPTTSTPVASQRWTPVGIDPYLTFGQHNVLSACAGRPRDSQLLGVTTTDGMTDVLSYAESNVSSMS